MYENKAVPICTDTLLSRHARGTEGYYHEVKIYINSYRY